MAFDFNMIKEVYSNIVKNVEEARKFVNKPLTLSEKILYSHLWDPASKSFERGKDYVDFKPIGLHVKMLPLRWLYYNLCRQVKTK